MYRKILVALENAGTDTCLLAHVSKLASAVGAELLLVHVAGGWTASHFDRLSPMESDDMKADRAHLENTAQRLREEGLQVAVECAIGHEPLDVLHTAQKHGCDLITLTSHGYTWMGDLLVGSINEKVRLGTGIPLLVVREVI